MLTLIIKPMSKKAKRIGDAITVENKDRKFGAATQYVYVRLQCEDKQEKVYLFTHNELARAEKRAAKNKEDLPVISWLRNLLD